MPKHLLIILFSVGIYHFPVLVEGKETTQQDSSEENRSPVQKQTVPAPNVIKTNPLATLWGQIPLTGELRLMYERRIKENHALYGAAGLNHPSLLINIENQVPDSIGGGVNLSGYRIQLGYKYYITKPAAPKGVYVSPHLSYNVAKIAMRDNPQNFVKFTYRNINLLIGYQALISNNISFDIFAGLGGKSNKYEVQYGPLFAIIPGFIESFIPNDVSTASIKPSFGFNVGVAF